MLYPEKAFFSDLSGQSAYSSLVHLQEQCRLHSRDLSNDELIQLFELKNLSR
jgi:hypothetical protein